MWIESTRFQNRRKPPNKLQNLWTTKWLTYQMKDLLSTIERDKKYTQRNSTNLYECILIENYLFICFLISQLNIYTDADVIKYVVCLFYFITQ